MRLPLTFSQTLANGFPKNPGNTPVLILVRDYSGYFARNILPSTSCAPGRPRGCRCPTGCSDSVSLALCDHKTMTALLQNDEFCYYWLA